MQFEWPLKVAIGFAPLRRSSLVSFLILISNSISVIAAPSASLCKLGASFRTFDGDASEIRSRFERGLVLASDAALCQRVDSGEKYLVLQFYRDTGNSTRKTFLVVRGDEEIVRATQVLSSNGYSL